MKILFFSPHADIDQHALLEILLAEKLDSKQHKIFYITCHKNFKNICACMYANGLNDDSNSSSKDKICVRCINKKTQILKTFNYTEIKLGDFVSAEEKYKIIKFINKNRKKPIHKIKFNNFPSGLFAAYEFLLTYKINSLRLNRNQKRKYLKHLENTLFSQIGTKKIIELIKPDRAVVYNALYSINRVFFENCKKKKIPCLSIHGGIHKKYRNQTLLFTSDPKMNFKRNSLSLWNIFKKIKNTQAERQIALEELSALRSGLDPWVYSCPPSLKTIDLQKINRINSSSKVIVILLSSSDEFFAATCTGFFKPKKKLLFKNQNEWIKYLIQVAKKNADIYFIFRVHPREFPNKRESQTSSNLEFYKELHKKNIKNIWVNFPDEKISLYDLIPLANLALTRTSTAGLEFLYAGKAVFGVDASLLTGYPPEFNLNYTSKSKYEEAIIGKNLVFQNKKEDIERWLNFSTSHLADWHPDIWKLNRKTLLQKIIFNYLKYFHKNKAETLVYNYKKFLEKIKKQNLPKLYFNKVASYLEMPYGVPRQH